jgi:ACR3 family arsenite transporter
VLWAISTLPLLLFLPGLLRGAWKSYAWMCFALMVYFQVFVTEIFRKPNDLITIGLLASLLLLFCTAMVFVWSRLTHGDPLFTLSQVALNDTIMVFAFAPLVGLLLGISAIIVPRKARYAENGVCPLR